MAQRKDRTGLIVLLVLLAAGAGFGGWYLMRQRRIAAEREAWSPLVSSLGAVNTEGLEQLKGLDPEQPPDSHALSGPVLIWSMDRSRVMHCAAAAGREAEPGSSGFTVLMVTKGIENTGTFQKMGSFGQPAPGVAPMKQHTLSIVVVDPGSGELLGAYKIFGSPPPSVSTVEEGFTGKDDVAEKFESWLGRSLR
jgi:hypothetical protein